MRRPLAVVVPLALALAGCSGDGDTAAPALADLTENDARCLDGDRSERPVVDWIEPAIELAQEQYGDPEFFEISADRQRVSVVVSVDGVAEQMFYCGDGGYVPPSPLGEAAGATFDGAAVDFDVDGIFGAIDDELDDPEIGDLAIVGDGSGGVVYDASVQSDEGGVLFVDLTPDGTIVGVRAS